ncbi:MAG: transglutaminase domain-containing protein [Candidatus Zhuqueibacterota bacterium]
MKTLRIWFMLGFLSWMSLCSQVSFAFVGEIVYTMNSPGDHPTGLAFDGKYLWVADRKTDNLYQIDPNNGLVIHTFPAPGFSPTGLAWDGTHLWAMDDKERFLYRMNIETGIAERVIEACTDNPKDICWDGTLLWVVDDKLDLVLSLDPEDGMMIHNFPSPADDPDGLAFDGHCLWIADRGENAIYRMDRNSGMVIGSIHAPDQYARGLAWDGAFLWNVDYQADKIYRIKIDDPVFLTKLSPKKQRLENTIDFRNYGPGTVISADVYLAIPENRDNQQLSRPVTFVPEPEKILTDQWGQKVAYFNVKNLKSGEFFRATMTIDATIWAAEYFIDPVKVGALESVPVEILKTYLADGKKLNVHEPFIQNLAKKIVGDEQNPYWMARKIFNYLIENLTYNLKPVGGWNTATTVLKRGTASCSEYSFSFIALCRAAGLPARYVGAVSQRGDDASLDEVYHRWCEVYLPNYGWIPFDANKGDKARPGEQAAGIGNIACRYIITTTGGGGSDYLDWTYNFNNRWTSKDKCRIYIEQYGEWSPLE